MFNAILFVIGLVSFVLLALIAIDVFLQTQRDIASTETERRCRAEAAERLKLETERSTLEADLAFKRGTAAGITEGQKFNLEELAHIQRAFNSMRDTVDAANSLEAAVRFKPQRFSLGDVRMKKKLLDEEIDLEAADRARREDAERSTQSGLQPGSPLERQILGIQKLIDECRASGDDAPQLRVTLDTLRRQAGLNRVLAAPALWWKFK